MIRPPIVPRARGNQNPSLAVGAYHKRDEAQNGTHDGEQDRDNLSIPRLEIQLHRAGFGLQ